MIVFFLISEYGEQNKKNAITHVLSSLLMMCSFLISSFSLALPLLTVLLTLV